MINSTSFSPVSFQTNTGATSIMPMGNKTVTVDGKTYPVVNMPYNSPYRTTLMQERRECAVIEGKIYPVQKVSSIFGSDMTKEVVTINGREYSVDSGLNLPMKKAVSEIGSIFLGRVPNENENANLDFIA